ncbi:MAG TPA: LPXTG cell wall anchor domain-containing protein [Acidimicrobiia bacterium]|nr:LPXTG cell wall anchor domain-containing protein [Acidimicrobiia bacterium]
MTIWRGRRCPAAVPPTLRAVGVGLFAAVMLAAPAMASDGRTEDPRDVGRRLDLKTLTHAQDGSSIVYTAETYGQFSDQSAAFKWGVDRDRDESFDLIVFTEWRDGKLVGGVKDPAGRQIAPATVSRPGPSAVRVSFPAEVLGDAAVYRYAVNAEAAPGDRDLAPNSGLVQHRLGGGGAAGVTGARTASSAPAAPAPAPPAASAAPAPAPVAAAAPASPAKTSLPRTGPGEPPLLPLSGLALMTGGALVALGARRSRIRRSEVTGGIR